MMSAPWANSELDGFAGQRDLVGRLDVAERRGDVLKHELVEHRLHVTQQTGFEGIDGDAFGFALLHHPQDRMVGAGEFVVDVAGHALYGLGVFALQLGDEQDRLALDRNVEADGPLVDRKEEAAGIADIGGREQQHAIEPELGAAPAQSFTHADAETLAQRDELVVPGERHTHNFASV